MAWTRAEWLELQRLSAAALGDSGLWETLQHRFATLNRRLAEGSLQIGDQDRHLARVTMTNVKIAIKFAGKMGIWAKDTFSRLEHDLRQHESIAEHHSEANGEVGVVAKAPMMEDDNPASDLRRWFLDNMTSPFPSHADKIHLRTLLPGCTNAHLNGWMANMRRRSGWTQGVTDFGNGSKLRWQHVLKRVNAGDKEASRAEKEYVRSIQDYVMGKRKPPIRMTKVGDWLEKLILRHYFNIAQVIAGSSVAEEDIFIDEDRVVKRRRIAGGRASVSRTDRFEARSTFDDGDEDEEDSKEGILAMEGVSRGPIPLHLPLQVPPHQRPLPSIPTLMQSGHLPLPAALASPVPRTVSASSSGTNISAISDGQLWSHLQQTHPQQLMYMPAYHYPIQPMQMAASPVMCIASSPAGQAQFSQGPYVFTGVEGGMYVPFNPYIPAVMGHDGRVRQEGVHGGELRGYDGGRGSKRALEENDEEMVPVWKRTRGS